MRKIVPYLFLGMLVVILFFIIGVRYGQKVEKTNKIVNYLISIAPTPTSIPLPTEQPLAFEPYSHSGCGVEFPRPVFFKIEKTSSDEALFTDNTKPALSFSCKKGIQPDKSASKSACLTLQNASLSCTRKNGTVQFTAYNPFNGKYLRFDAEENLLPFLESSLRFVLK